MHKITCFLYAIYRKIILYKHRIYIRRLVSNGLKLGNNVTIATTASIDDEYCYLISIGDNCTVSHHARILAHDATTFKFTDGYTRIGKVEIKDNCYFGENVLILPGVTVGPNVLVAAGSVVNKDIPPNSCVAGVPARFYGKFDEFIADHQNKIKESQVFNFSDVYLHRSDSLRKKIIESVQAGDAYVQGYSGRFPTTFNPDDKLCLEKTITNNKIIGFDKIRPWIISYFINQAKKSFEPKNPGQKHIFLCICDHFEPLWNNAYREKGLNRVKAWTESYPKIAAKFNDSDGQIPKYTFFYPIEEYQPEYLDLLAELCRKGYSEVEVHLHHDNDTSDNLRKTLTNYKNMLAERHGLLSKDKNTGEIKYGFIHGNWALDNSRPDGRWCGVNNELEILQETGCYADFTLPSAPDITQTTKINSIYYALDNPKEPKSHNEGINAQAKTNIQKGLLMVQGPLLLNLRNRKWGILPRIENGFIGSSYPLSAERIKLWLDNPIHLQDAPEYIFVKLYTHGCQENNSNYLLNGGLDKLFSLFLEHYNDGNNYLSHFVSARELVNIVKALEANSTDSIAKMRQFSLNLIGENELPSQV